MLVNVTSFFRDAAAWASLREHVRDLVRTLDDGTPIRAWVAGCATGEEAYSVAVTISEVVVRELPSEHPVKVFATDIRRARWTPRAAGATRGTVRVRCRRGGWTGTSSSTTTR